MKKLLLPVFFLIVINHQNLFSQTTTWGDANSRTETRNDAGLQGNAGALSGFFQTQNPNNFPAGASNWWHLLDVRHSNTANNFAMQFSGSFFDQSLYFRKTNNIASQAWSRVLLENNGRAVIGNTSLASGVSALDIDTKSDWNNTSYIRLMGSTYQPQYYNLTINKQQTGNNGTSNPTFNYNFDRAQFGTGGFNGTQLSLKWNGDVGIGGGITFQDAGGYLLGGSIKPGVDGLVTNGGNKHIITAGNEVRINAPFLLAKKVKVSVKPEDWSDYVFAPGYHLRSLTSVENYINKYKHLPDIPSAEEVEKNDLDLGANQALLLRKIEELTLYMIQQDKTIKTQQEMLESLKKEIENKGNKTKSLN